MRYAYSINVNLNYNYEICDGILVYYIKLICCQIFKMRKKMIIKTKTKLTKNITYH
jgi:hypothetical protein